MFAQPGPIMINTVSGSIPITSLGKTLMHEHLIIGFSGWEGDTKCDPLDRRNIIARCVDAIEELKDAGFQSLLDPCPNDLGRDVDVMGEVASRTGFNVLFATGLYDDRFGGSYWKTKVAYDPDAVKYITEMYVNEIVNGIGATGCKPAIIKVATGEAPFTAYELATMRAAATAAIETGAPITTHTNAIDGDKQIEFFADRGIKPERLIIGHSCGSNDHAYHQAICDSGCYIGFDRFGIETINSDDNRVDSLARLIAHGYRDHLIVSHDCTLNMMGQIIDKVALDNLLSIRPMHFTRNIIPKLVSKGITISDIESVLTNNPMKYFAGDNPKH